MMLKTIQRVFKSASFRLLVLSVFVVCGFWALNAGDSQFISSDAHAGVLGGPHDLSIDGGSQLKFTTFQICVFCHTPHSANMTQSYDTDPGSPNSNGILNGMYLWNRQTPDRAFDYYAPTSTKDAPNSQPGSLSLLCLSCHDGIGALNVLLNNPGDSYKIPGGIDGNGNVSAFAGTPYNQFGDINPDDPIWKALNLNIGAGDADHGLGTAGVAGTGTNLTEDHPIGFIYNNVVIVDNMLRPVSDPGFPTELKDRLNNVTEGRVECSTCHDPHIDNLSYPTNGNKFLVMDNTDSAMCIGCHLK